MVFTPSLSNRQSAPEESKYKKRAEQAFGGSHPDVLIDELVLPVASVARNNVSERVEPKLGANLSGYAAEAAADDGDDLTPIGDSHSFAASTNKSVAHTSHLPHTSHTSHTPAFATSLTPPMSPSPTSSTAMPTAPMLHADIDCIALILADAPIEAARLADQNGLNVQSISLSIGEYLHHNEIFGGTSQEFNVIGKLVICCACHGALFKWQAAKRDINWRSIGQPANVDARLRGKFARRCDARRE